MAILMKDFLENPHSRTSEVCVSCRKELAEGEPLPAVIVSAEQPQEEKKEVQST